MRRCATTLVASLFVGVLLIPIVASADPGDVITFRLEGTVSTIENIIPVGFELGDPFVVVFEVDTSVLDVSPPDYAGVYPAAASLVSASIGTYEVGSSIPASISVTDDQPNGQDLWEGIGAQWWQSVTGDPLDPEFPSHPGPAVPRELQFSLSDHDSDGSLLTSDSIPTMALDVSRFDHRWIFLSFNARDCDPQQDEFECQLSSNVQATINSMSVVQTDPNGDDDGDGVANSIDDGGDGTFVDGNAPPTTGEIVEAAGLDVFVVDALGPAGVRITATGTGGPAIMEVCGFTIHIATGSDAIITCGSVIVEAVAGDVIVLLANGNSVIIPEGGHAEVDQLQDGAVVVDNFGSIPITAILNDVTYTIPSGISTSFSDDDGDHVFNQDDMCPYTSELGSATTPDLQKNRYAVDAFGVFLSSNGTSSGSTIHDTAGCDEHQIINALHLGKGHTKHGLSKGALQNWVSHVAS